MFTDNNDFMKLIYAYLFSFSFTYVLFISIIKSNLISQTDISAITSIISINSIDSFLIVILAFTVITVTLIFYYSYKYNNNRYIDLYWSFNGLFIICLALAYLDIKNLMFGNPNFNEKVIMLLIISLVFLYSSRHFLIYGRSFKSLSLEHEDFRYVSFRAGFGNRKFLYWLFTYLFLHLYPIMLEACLFYYTFQVIAIFNRFEIEPKDQHREMLYNC